MANFFRTVADFFIIIYRFIGQFFRGILLIPELFSRATDFLNTFMVYLPAELIVFIAIILFLCVLLMLIGR